MDTSKPVGFRSLTYRFGLIYNFLNLRLYDWKRKFITLASLVGKSEKTDASLKVLDLAYGTGYLVKYLHPSVDYEGWDLNDSFLNIIRKDWNKGKIPVKRLSVQHKNILDFKNYPDEKKDVILLSDILHHVYPHHIEAIENARHHASTTLTFVMELRGTLRARDVLAAQWLHIKPRPIYAVIGLLLSTIRSGHRGLSGHACSQDRQTMKAGYTPQGVRV